MSRLMCLLSWIRSRGGASESRLLQCAEFAFPCETELVVIGALPVCTRGYAYQRLGLCRVVLTLSLGDVVPPEPYSFETKPIILISSRAAGKV